MYSKPLKELIDRIAEKIRSLERERDEALSRSRVLESEIASFIVLTSEVKTQLEALLADGNAKDKTAISNRLDQHGLHEFSSDPVRRGKDPGGT